MLRTIYGFDDLGRKIPTGSYDDGYNPVGGRIFYIDSNSDETVKFYDSNFNELSSVAVGDTPSYYKVTSAGVSGKEKYFVYTDTIGENKYWGYYNIEVPVHAYSEPGKLCTSETLAVEDTSIYHTGSIWEWIVNQNNNNLNYCNDWYIGSNGEIQNLREFLDSSNDSSLINYFNIYPYHIWSSRITHQSFYPYSWNWDEYHNKEWEYTDAGLNRKYQMNVIPFRSF